MSRERVLGEFKARAAKTKNAYEQTKYQCEMLKKQAIQLERDLLEVQDQRKKAQVDIVSLQETFQSASQQNEVEYRKCQKDQEEIVTLRRIKKDLKREHDLLGHDIQKQCNKLEEVMTERLTLQQSAKVMGERLQYISDEKLQMEVETQAQTKQIASLTEQIQGLNNDMDAMRQILTHSFHQE